MKLLLPDKHHACNAIAMFIEKVEYQAISSRGQHISSFFPLFPLDVGKEVESCPPFRWLQEGLSYN